MLQTTIVCCKRLSAKERVEMESFSPSDRRFSTPNFHLHVKICAAHKGLISIGSLSLFVSLFLLLSLSLSFSLSASSLFPLSLPLTPPSLRSLSPFLSLLPLKSLPNINLAVCFPLSLCTSPPPCSWRCSIIRLFSWPLIGHHPL